MDHPWISIGALGQDPKPCFIYWATYCQQLQGVSSHFNDPHVDHMNAQASMMAAHSSYVTRLLQTLKEEKIAENTLVVWMSDSCEMGEMGHGY